MAELKAGTRAEEVIKEYLENETPEIFKQKLKESEKTLAGCMEYIFREAKKQAVNNRACITDQEVFGWAVHFFEEDDIKEPPVKKEVHATVNVSKPTAKPPVKVQPKKDDTQLSLFDMMGG